MFVTIFDIDSLVGTVFNGQVTHSHIYSFTRYILVTLSQPSTHSPAHQAHSSFILLQCFSRSRQASIAGSDIISYLICPR
jgi:hypothetical protein